LESKVVCHWFSCSTSAAAIEETNGTKPRDYRKRLPIYSTLNVPNAEQEMVERFATANFAPSRWPPDMRDEVADAQQTQTNLIQRKQKALEEEKGLSSEASKA
jgi:hypothetical protein